MATAPVGGVTVGAMRVEGQGPVGAAAVLG